MDEATYHDDSLKQAWAEGYHLDPENLLQNPSRWLDEKISLPMRSTASYAFTPFPVGSIKVKRWLPLEVMRPRIRGLWSGALQGLQGQVPIEDEAQFNEIVHWPYLVTTVTPSWLNGAATDADSVLQQWLAHRVHIQKTRAEQYLLDLGRRPLWHPYREATGAMRRAPLWGVLQAAIPAQAGALAYHDALVAQGGWGTWTACAVAQIAAHLCHPGRQGCLADVFTATIDEIAGYRDSQPAALSLLAHCKSVCLHERSWDTRIREVLEPFAGYPKDHSLPNFAIVMTAALSFSHDPSDTAIAAIRRAGWDGLGNSLVFGALQGIHNPPAPSNVLPAFGENGIARTIALLPKSPSLRRR